LFLTHQRTINSPMFPIGVIVLEILKQLRVELCSLSMGGGGVNQLYVSLNNFIPFKTLLIFLHVSSTTYNIWTVKVKIISHT
jgi:hypothetical protein